MYRKFWWKSLKRKNHSRKLKRVRQKNIKPNILKTVYEHLDRLQVAQDRNQGKTFLKTKIKFWVP